MALYRVWVGGFHRGTVAGKDETEALEIAKHRYGYKAIVTLIAD